MTVVYAITDDMEIEPITSTGSDGRETIYVEGCHNTCQITKDGSNVIRCEQYGDENGVKTCGDIMYTYKDRMLW